MLGPWPRLHAAVAGLQGAAWPLIASAYLPPQLSEIPAGGAAPLRGAARGLLPQRPPGPASNQGLPSALRRGRVLSGRRCPRPSPWGDKGRVQRPAPVSVCVGGGRRLPASIPVAKATPSIAVPTATSLGTLKRGISEPGGARCGAAADSGAARAGHTRARGGTARRRRRHVVAAR